MPFAPGFELEITFLDGSKERVAGNVRYIEDFVLYVVQESGNPGAYVNRELVGGYSLAGIRKWIVVGH